MPRDLLFGYKLHGEDFLIIQIPFFKVNKELEKRESSFMSRTSGISSGQRFMCNDMSERISKMVTWQKHYHKPIQRNETFEKVVLSSTKAL